MQGVEFQGFAGDCTITGKITMFGERLTDFLNGQERFRLHKVEFQSLDDGHIVAQDSVSIVRNDLLAVVGTGPRGTRSIGSSSRKPGCSCRSGRTSSWAGCTSRPARIPCATSSSASR